MCSFLGEQADEGYPYKWSEFVQLANSIIKAALIEK
jgi:hypothetical protein